MNRGPQEATLKRIRAKDWDGSARRLLRPVSKRSRLKVRLKDRFQDPIQRSRDHPDPGLMESKVGAFCRHLSVSPTFPTEASGSCRITLERFRGHALSRLSGPPLELRDGYSPVPKRANPYVLNAREVYRLFLVA